MTFIISKSKGSGRFKYGKRHPKDHTKWAFMSQGSWSTHQEAKDEGDLVEKEIQKGLQHTVDGLRGRVNDLRKTVQRHENVKIELVEQKRDLEFRVDTLRTSRTIPNLSLIHI